MNLLARIPTAIVLVSIAVFGILKGSIVFFTGVSIITLLCLHEILKMKKLYISKLYTVLLYCFLILFLLLTQAPSYTLFWNSPFIIIASTLIVVISCLEVFLKKTIASPNKYSQALISTIKIGLAFPFFILLRNTPSGLDITFLFIIIVATVDSASYFSGKFLGKTQFNTISPNKTLEGSLGGIITTIVSSVIMLTILNYNLVAFFPLIFIIIFLAILGDLHESLQKRSFNVKDSASILPGHGGIYDRMDSYILALPITYYYVIFFL